MRSRVPTVKLLSLLALMLMLSACQKEKQTNSGTVTIDNMLVPSGQTYAVFGFSFELGKIISNLEVPGPDITVHLRTDISGVTGKYFDSDNYSDSFALAGEYETEAEAKAAFNNLPEVGSPVWQQTAEDIEEHQLWLFKTSEDNYVKFRISGLEINEMMDPPFIQVSFQWQIQPDGSTSFSR